MKGDRGSSSGIIVSLIGTGRLRGGSFKYNHLTRTLQQPFYATTVSHITARLYTVQDVE